MFHKRSNASALATTSAYERLGERLSAIGAATIILSFAEIEAVIGPLPTVARYQSAWWGATPFGRYNTVQALRWGRVGYVAVHPDFVTQTVTFQRRAR